MAVAQAAGTGYDPDAFQLHRRSGPWRLDSGGDSLGGVEVETISCGPSSDVREIVDQLGCAVQLAFRVSLTCANVHSGLDPERARLLDTGVAELDDLVCVLQRVALSLQLPGPPGWSTKDVPIELSSDPIAEAAHTLDDITSSPTKRLDSASRTEKASSPR